MFVQLALRLCFGVWATPVLKAGLDKHDHATSEQAGLAQKCRGKERSRRRSKFLWFALAPKPEVPGTGTESKPAATPCQLDSRQGQVKQDIPVTPQPFLLALALSINSKWNRSCSSVSGSFSVLSPVGYPHHGSTR